MGSSCRRRRRRLLAAAGVVLGICGGLPGGVPAAAGEQPEPRRFIVTLRDSVANPTAVAAEHSARHGGQVDFVYRHALKGYAATFRGGGIAEVARDGRVAGVEPDGTSEAWATQTGATWGLDRTDQRARALDGSFTYISTGAGVTAYIIDTGIRFDHAEFGGRAVSGFDAVDGGTADDCHGHGTHVAGTVGGTTYGVAKAVSLVAVRVLNCAGAGANAGVIAGIDWVTAHHQSGAPAVANMSLGGSASAAVDTAVRNSINDGVSYAVAAGNGFFGLFHQNACNSSPARVPEALTISATDRNDRKASWANYGNCVDWFAPGVDITSAWHTGAAATNTISGTSMATPHTAGVAAQYLQANPAASPAAVRAALYANTTKGVVTSASTANNHLLFSNY